MEFYKRVLKLHQFRNLGKNSPTELLLNSSFGEIKHGELVVLVGENNVGKSNVLEALKIFNDADVKLCSEEDYFKNHEKDSLLSLEEETSFNNKTTGFSCVDLKIRFKEINKEVKELSKTLIVYPFEKHVKVLGEQCSNFVSIPINNDDYSNICTFVSNFINLIISYNPLKPFLDFYKEKLKLSELVTKYANATNNLLFKEFIKYLSGNSEWIKTFCQCIKEIIKCNTPNKKYNSYEFFVIWESIKILDNESGIYLFPKNIGEIKDKFEANKEKFKQSKNASEFAEYCRECNPYTAFNFHLNINNGLSHQFEKFVPIMKEYKEPKITDNDLEAISTKETGLASQLSGHWFFQLSLFNKTNFNPNKIWIPLEFNKRSKIKFDKDLEIYFDSHESFNISKKYLQEIDQESLKKIKQSKDFFPIQKIESKHDNNDILQLEFFENDTSFLFAKGSFAEILEYNMQLKINSLITKEFNKLLAIAEDSPQDSYQLKIRVRHNNKFYDYSKESTAYEIKLEIHDCRKSDNQNEPIILSQQSTGFQWAFNFMFGFLYNVGSHFSLNKNIIYVMDEPATHLSVPARKEFRKFLKEYAHKNHVTFVLATHDPFLVDVDHLDEIRIVEKETEGSAIKNHFNYPLNNAGKDSDALDKIKRSLGVGQHVFHNPQKHRIIFVEGITDYCYLSAFKLYFNKHNPQFKDNPIPFTFLPISGLKNDSNAMKETIKKLCELDNHPIVLTDDDRKCVFNQKATSERFKRANEEMHDPITILQLSDCDRCFKQIEDCFSANDRNKYAGNKRMELVMAFKTRLLYGEKDDAVSEETKNNFLCLFEWMKKRVQQPND
ncbi:hypothetical protein ckin22_01470 [Helicobacter pylori]|nr:ATP-binding protein [Helicobacter pylori]